MTNSVTARKLFSAISVFLSTIFFAMSLVMLIDYFINKDVSAILSSAWTWAYLTCGISAILAVYIKRGIPPEHLFEENEHK